MMEPSPGLLAKFLPLTDAQIWQAWREVPVGFAPHHDHVCDLLTSLKEYRRCGSWVEAIAIADNKREAREREKAERRAASEKRTAERIALSERAKLVVRRLRLGSAETQPTNPESYSLNLPRRPMLTLDDYDAGRYVRTLRF